MKYFACLWAAVVVYAVSSSFVGAMGLSAYKDLLAKRERQRQNLDRLEAVNSELEGVRNSLLYDKDSISVYARDLGFGAGDERFVRVQGFASLPRPEIEAGMVYRPTEGAYVPDKTLRLFALCVGAAFFICAAAIDIFRFLRDS